MARLGTIPFFKDAGIELVPFETRCHWRRFDENETLVDFDDISTDVYFLSSGEVRILNRTQSGKEVILGEMRGGAFFGELAAIDGIGRSANVTALTRAKSAWSRPPCSGRSSSPRRSSPTGSCGSWPSGCGN